MGPTMLLSADLSDALLALMQNDVHLVDAVEVGPWFTVQQIRNYRQLLPDMPFYFHASDLIEGVGLTSECVPKIEDYLASTGSPWASVHLSVWQPGDVGKMKAGQRVPLPDPESGAQRIISKVNLLAHAISVPVLIENIEPLPLEGYTFWSKPDFIGRVCEETGCGFLLDTGHARISAESLGIGIHDYLRDLPLDRVVQVHVSGPRRVEGLLVDTHQPLQDEDYGIFAFILGVTQPKVITLEYIQKADAQLKQLIKLRSLCSDNQSSNAKTQRSL